MEALYRWLYQFIFVAFLSGFLLTLVANTVYEKYVRFYVELLLVLFLVRSFLFLFSKENQVLESWEEHIESMTEGDWKKEIEDNVSIEMELKNDNEKEIIYHDRNSKELE